MFGNTNVSEDVSKLHDQLKAIDPNLEIRTTEKYANSVINGHTLEIDILVYNKVTHETASLKKFNIKIPKNVPTYLTKHQLWHHTRGELLQLEELRKAKKERRPSTETLNEWKKLMELEKKKSTNNVLLSNNIKK